MGASACRQAPLIEVEDEIVEGGARCPTQKYRSGRLILIRHGESEGNVRREVTAHVPDPQIHLTMRGREQAEISGKNLKQLVGDQGLKFMVSPYVRAKETMNGIARTFGGKEKLHVKEDVLLREQDFGNFDRPEARELHKEKKRFGKFYYRFPEGESPADVYNRAGLVLESLYRRWSTPRGYIDNTVIVSHELFITVFLMRMFRWEIQDYYELEGLKNAEMIVLERSSENNDYEITQCWAPGEAPIAGGLRRMPSDKCPKMTEVWDGNPESALLESTWVK